MQENLVELGDLIYNANLILERVSEYMSWGSHKQSSDRSITLSEMT